MQSTNVRKTQGGARGASLPRHHTGQLSAGDGGRGQPVEGTTACDGPGMEVLVPGRECVH